MKKINTKKKRFSSFSFLVSLANRRKSDKCLDGIKKVWFFAVSQIITIIIRYILCASMHPMYTNTSAQKKNENYFHFGDIWSFVYSSSPCKMRKMSYICSAVHRTWSHSLSRNIITKHCRIPHYYYFGVGTSIFFDYRQLDDFVMSTNHEQCLIPFKCRNSFGQKFKDV